MTENKPIVTYENVTVDELYKRVQNNFERTNSVYRLEAILDDGSGPIRIVFTSPRGNSLDQRQRVGKLEVFYE